MTWTGNATFFLDRGSDHVEVILCWLVTFKTYWSTLSWLVMVNISFIYFCIRQSQRDWYTRECWRIKSCQKKHLYVRSSKQLSKDTNYQTKKLYVKSFLQTNEIKTIFMKKLKSQNTWKIIHEYAYGITCKSFTGGCCKHAKEGVGAHQTAKRRRERGRGSWWRREGDASDWHQSP